MTRGVPLLVALLSCQPAPEPAQEEEPPEATQPEEVPLSPEEQLKQISAALDDVKSELANAGKYSCCTFPTCNWCALHEGACSCYANVEAKKEVCPGCGLGWHNGNGMVEGFEASQVKWNITHEHPAAGGHEH
jgi:hypothetical protein